MADLSWLPYDVEEWETRVRELRLSFADEGALMRLVRGTWAAAVPCSIADDADEFARVLGAHWKKALPILRAQFTVHPEQKGMLRCEWLWALWQRQLEKHLSYQNRGRMGGRPKSSATSSAISSGESSASSSPSMNGIAQVPANFATGEAGLSQNSTEVLSSAPPSSGHRTKNPATGSALAPSGAALRAPDASGGGERTARLRQLQEEYASKLRDRYRLWTEKRPEEARMLEQVERTKLGYPVDVELRKWQQQAVTAGVLVAWRALPHKQPIPSCDEWIAEQEREWVPAELEADEADAVGATP